MATLTAAAAVASNQARVPSGPELVQRIFTYVSSATLSAGDVVLMNSARIPHGAIITRCRVSGRAVDGTAIVTPFVRVGATDTTFGSLTLSVAGRIGDALHTSAADSAHLPFTVSVSDDASIRYATLGFLAGTHASGTGSMSVSFILDYIMDN